MTLLRSASDIEAERLLRQVALDNERTAQQRNEWGQFATPPVLAEEIVRYSLSLHDDAVVRFLEPSCGSGSFFSALLRECSTTKHQIAEAVGVELDERFAILANDLWSQKGLKVVLGDFADPTIVPRNTHSLVVANPPYVRHHHIESSLKKTLVGRAANELGITVSGLAGLYLHFVLLADRALAPGAISSWLIPSEFMDVNYGSALKQYLTEHVTLVRVHRFDAADVQFGDALVTSAVVTFQNTPPSPQHRVSFTRGGTLDKPRQTRLVPVGALSARAKWNQHFESSAAPVHDARNHPTMADYFTVRRGIATGGNGFFVLLQEQALHLGFKPQHLRPILPSPRYLKTERVAARTDGYPDIPKPLALINTGKPLRQLQIEDPAVANYLSNAPEKITSAYLTSKRNPWYAQEHREVAPILLTYMGRGTDLDKPFRFILNESQAIVANSYLMLYPTPVLRRFLDSTGDGLALLHEALTSISGKALRAAGRVYGGGLHKIEPKELLALDATAVRDLDPDLLDSALPTLFDGLGAAA